MKINIDMNKIFTATLDEWLKNIEDGKISVTPIVLSSGAKIPREQLAHVELLLLNYHKALMKELEQSADDNG